MIAITKWLASALFLTLVVLSPNFNLIPFLRDYDAKRVLELILIFFVLFWAILGGMDARPPFFKKQTKLVFFGIIALSAFSAVFAASPRHAILEISSYLGLFYGTQLVVSLWQDYRIKLVQLTIAMVLLSAVLYIIGFYSGYLASFLEDIAAINVSDLYLGFSTVRAFNQFQLWTLALLYLPLLGFTSNKVQIRYGLVFILVFWWTLLFASACRGALVAWPIAMLVTAGVYKRYAWPLLRLQLLCFSLGIVCYGLLFKWLPSFFSSGTIPQTALRATTNDRLSLWQQAGWMIKTHPWLGVGPMNYAWYPNLIAAHPHNSLLQLAAEWGLLATLLVFGLGVYGIFCWLQRFSYAEIKAKPDKERHLLVGLFFTLILNSCYSMVDGVIVMPLSQVLMTFILGLVFGIYFEGHEQLNSRPKFIHRLVAGVVLIALLWSVLPDLLPRLLSHVDLIPRSYQTLGPRFWQDGGIAH